jgi:hypothetical protein
MNKYSIEVTDTFGEVANYSWVRRYVIEAKSFRGAICKLARMDGAGWRCVHDAGDWREYRMFGVCIVCFITII